MGEISPKSFLAIAVFDTRTEWVFVLPRQSFERMRYLTEGSSVIEVARSVFDCLLASREISDYADVSEITFSGSAVEIEGVSRRFVCCKASVNDLPQKLQYRDVSTVNVTDQHNKMLQSLTNAVSQRYGRGTVSVV